MWRINPLLSIWAALASIAHLHLKQADWIVMCSHVSGMLMPQMTALTGRQRSANLSSEVLPFFESSDSWLRRWSGACFLPYVPVVEVVLHVCLDISVSCTWLLTHFGNTFIKFPCWRSPVSWWDVFGVVRPTLVEKGDMIWSERF